jgi:uncharacterized protein (TIGR02118 family)
MIWFASLQPGANCLSAGGRRIGGSSAQSPFTVRSSRDGFYGQPEGDLMIKIMLLLHRRTDLSVEEFRRYWHTEHQALLVLLPGLRRLVLNDVLPGLDGASGPCDGIAEDWFDSPEAMQAAFASAEGQAVAADTAHFLDPTRLQILVVNEQDVGLPVARS